MITRLPNPNTTKRIKCGHDQLICKSAGYVFAGGYGVTSVAAACSFPPLSQFGKDSAGLIFSAAVELWVSRPGAGWPVQRGHLSHRLVVLSAPVRRLPTAS